MAKMPYFVLAVVAYYPSPLGYVFSFGLLIKKFPYEPEVKCSVEANICVRGEISSQVYTAPIQDMANFFSV